MVVKGGTEPAFLTDELSHEFVIAFVLLVCVCARDTYAVCYLCFIIEYFNILGLGQVDNNECLLLVSNQYGLLRLAQSHKICL